MRLALFTDSFTPQQNGVSRTLERLVRETEDRGGQARVFTVDDPRAPRSRNGRVRRAASIALPYHPEIRISLPAVDMLPAVDRRLQTVAGARRDAVRRRPHRPTRRGAHRHPVRQLVPSRASRPTPATSDSARWRRRRGAISGGFTTPAGARSVRRSRRSASCAIADSGDSRSGDAEWTRAIRSVVPIAGDAPALRRGRRYDRRGVRGTHRAREGGRVAARCDGMPPASPERCRVRVRGRRSLSGALPRRRSRSRDLPRPARRRCTERVLRLGGHRRLPLVDGHVRGRARGSDGEWIAGRRGRLRVNAGDRRWRRGRTMRRTTRANSRTRSSRSSSTRRGDGRWGRAARIRSSLFGWGPVFDDLFAEYESALGGRDRARAVAS